MVVSLAMDGPRRLVCGDRAGGLAVLDLATGARLATLPPHGGEVVALAVAADPGPGGGGLGGGLGGGVAFTAGADGALRAYDLGPQVGRGVGVG